MIKFTILGKQRPQGSKISHALYKKSGEPVMKNGRVITITRESCKHLAGWRNQVAGAALAAVCATHPHGESPPLIQGGVKLTVVFIMARPKSHFRTGRYAGVLKESAPVCHAQRPDRDKLARAVGDALKGIAYRDDGQICCGDIIKRWGERYETIVQIEMIEEQPKSILDSKT